VSGKPAAFMSYARFNDEHDDGQLSAFRDRLAAEVRAQTGLEFVIFQDRTNIEWGMNWQQRIDETLDVVTLLLVVITPGFFRSKACREELARFLEREQQMGRSDLILPLYYISSREVDDPKVRETDELAKVLRTRQMTDWRELRFEPLTSTVIRKAIAQLASRMRDTFWYPAPIPEHDVHGGGHQADAVGQAKQSDPGNRETAKTEPPTHVVDIWQRGDFSTIGAAIEAARAGDRILVRPGVYDEGLVVDKPLEIMGDGPVADIEIRASGASVLLFRASIGRVANLTLRQTGGEGDWYGVDITQGRLDLEGCDISSQSLACVAIHDGADPRLRRNQCHDGKDAGVYVYDNGLGTLEDNEISANTTAGIAIKGGGNPTVRRNRIHDGKNAGIYVYDGGLGTLEDNDITANTLAGVVIRGGNPIVRRNQIHGGKNAGIHVYDDGTGTIEDNDITANTTAGVAIKTGGNPTVRRNQIHDGKNAGVYVYENGLGTIEDNEISGNALGAIVVIDGGNPTARRNQLRDGKDCGIYVYDKGLGTYEDNDIAGNTTAGVVVKTGGNPTMRRNKIHDGKRSGVYVHDDGLGTFEDNDITANTLAGVAIQSGANPVMRGNQIHDGKNCGVHVYDDGLGTLEDNTILANANAGIAIKTGANPTVRRNRVNGNLGPGVQIEDGGRGVIENNDLTGNREPWDITDDSEAGVVRSGNKE
jgi:parallel beta-helix repeat protein